MEKVLVSACLLGARVRYNGSDKVVSDGVLVRWIAEGRVVPLCPEVAAGLPTPRPPAEIRGAGGGAVLRGQAQVVDARGNDVSEAFVRGAEQALALVREQRIRVAVLTERSPSCGSSLIYDGGFGGVTRPGEGATTALLREHGVAVFNEEQLGEAAACLSRFDDEAGS
ncbi:DUF523 domain-containing protein [Stutzerimonas nosocomialis]|uniref:DUF523 domain-containing protein n=1 Tax=Stutzerimonas nosocomialis TaxID=1056496 RepID=UPI0011095FDA|nr:DUF523 domain-containing protein [Stutzerimonas nosocomialis]TLX57989.1 DUF523 domain-containing protein [Stutzerimonas nosocomialis]